MKQKNKALIGVGAIAGILLFCVLSYQYHRCTSSFEDASNGRSVCSIDTNAAYRIMWQKLFLTRDQIHEEYYKNHITMISLI